MNMYNEFVKTKQKTVIRIGHFHRRDSLGMSVSNVIAK